MHARHSEHVFSTFSYSVSSYEENNFLPDPSTSELKSPPIARVLSSETEYVLPRS